MPTSTMEHRLRQYCQSNSMPFSDVAYLPPELPPPASPPLVDRTHLPKGVAKQVGKSKRLQQLVAWLVPEINKVAPQLKDHEKTALSVEFNAGFFNLDLPAQLTPQRHNIAPRLKGRTLNVRDARVYHWILETLYPSHPDAKDIRRQLESKISKNGLLPLAAPHMPEAFSLIRTNPQPISKELEIFYAEKDIILTANDKKKLAETMKKHQDEIQKLQAQQAGQKRQQDELKREQDEWKRQKTKREARQRVLEQKLELQGSQNVESETTAPGLLFNSDGEPKAFEQKTIDPRLLFNNDKAFYNFYGWDAVRPPPLVPPHKPPPLSKIFGPNSSAVLTPAGMSGFMEYVNLQKGKEVPQPMPMPQPNGSQTSRGPFVPGFSNPTLPVSLNGDFANDPFITDHVARRRKDKDLSRQNWDTEVQQPTPVVQSMPLELPMPVVQPTPGVQPTPVVQPMPLELPMALEQPMPVEQKPEQPFAPGFLDPSLPACLDDLPMDEFYKQFGDRFVNLNENWEPDP